MPKDDKKFVEPCRDARTIGQREERIVYKQRLARLAYLSGKIDWENRGERLEFLDQVYTLINEWEGTFLNLREVLSSNKIKCLLLDSVLPSYDYYGETDLRTRFIEIVIQSGYKNEPELDEAGKPVLLRDTALLRAARNKDENCARLLFKIYDRFDVNYTDGSGRSHFHVACRYGCEEAVKKFLELGQDPNLVDESDNPPLNLLLRHASRKKEAMESLLRNGADPNSLDNCYDCDAPLHLICQRGNVELLDAFFKINDELGNEVEVDQENAEWTPLQVAIFNHRADMVEYLLKNHKGDPSKVVCPYELGGWDYANDEFYLKVVSSCLTIVDTLEKYGYELNRQVAEDIKEDFDNHDLLEKLADLAENWYCCEDFRREAEQIMVKPGLSLYHLVQLPYDEAKELVTYMEFCKFSRSDKLEQLPLRYRENCTVHLIKTMSLGFLQRWGLDLKQ